MLKHTFFPQRLIFDIETVPCLETARRVYPQLADIADDRDALAALYAMTGTPDNPKPFLKYFLHRVVSISGINRTEGKHGVLLKAFRLHGEDEVAIMLPFLRGIGEKQPQLIGWSSSLFDIHVLAQRALLHGLSVPKFFYRPDKPWEGADYFTKFSDYHLDLLNAISSSSAQSKTSLNEFARALRIPGKLAVSGADVAEMWFNGLHSEIADYNDCDTATTYLIWLRMHYAAGMVSEAAYETELTQFREMLVEEAEKGLAHYRVFLDEWDSLQRN